MVKSVTQIGLDTIKRSAALTIAAVGIFLVLVSNTIHTAGISVATGILGLLMVTAASTLELYKYLQDVRRRNPGLRADIYARKEAERRDNRFANMEASLTALRRRVETLSEGAAQAVGDIPESVTQTLLARIRDSATEDMVAQWAERFGRTAIVEGHIKQIRASVAGAISSLEEEIEALGKRSNVQMASGATVSIVGFIVLGIFIYRNGDEIDLAHLDGKLVGYLLLRLGLVVMIELFALFFLRMYRYSVFEIKYFQNEISNIYLKSVAVEMAFSDDDKTINTSIVKELISSERNIVIHKGDVSLSQLRDIAEREGDAVLLNFIKSVPDSLAGFAKTLFKKTP